MKRRLLLALLAASAFAGTAWGQDRIVAGKNTGVGSASLAVTCMDPTTGVLNSCTGSASQTGNNVSDTPTITAGPYVSGNCMGGFRTISLGTASSVLSAVSLSSKGGLATAKQIYLFYANPTNSTCTDAGTFTLNAADVSKLIPGGVFTLTPAAPTGTTITRAAQTNIGAGIPSGGVIYAAIVETTSETPGSTTDLVTTFTAF